MKQYIARQPIFTVDKKVYAYELLYRGRKNYALDKVSGDRATASLLTSSFLTKDIQDLSSYRLSFINFTEDLLVSLLPASFPQASIVIEILEDVEPRPEVIEACTELKRQGYRIALDDFIYDYKFIPLLRLADIVKIDFRLTPVQTIHRTLEMLSGYNVKLLAEKVETMEEFEEAIRLGFMYFQGYFFCKPEQITIQELAPSKLTYVRLLSEVSQEDISLTALNEIISSDIAISHKLLRFLNSSYFYRRQEVKSIKHAMGFLGQKELRNFVMLVIVSELATSKPGELTRNALVRAKFCELLSKEGTSRYSDELFMTGLFSLLDVMLDNSMEYVMELLPVSDHMKEALLNSSGEFSVFLAIAKGYEQGNVRQYAPLLDHVSLPAEKANDLYLSAIKYANGLVRGQENA